MMCVEVASFLEDPVNSRSKCGTERLKREKEAAGRALDHLHSFILN